MLYCIDLWRIEEGTLEMVVVMVLLLIGYSTEEERTKKQKMQIRIGIEEA